MHFVATRRHEATLERVLEITPGDIAVASSMPSWIWIGKRILRLYTSSLDRLRSERPSVVGDTADLWFLCALAERDWAAAEQALTALGNNPFWA